MRFRRFLTAVFLAAVFITTLSAQCIPANPVQILFGASVDEKGCLIIVPRPGEKLPEGFEEVFGPRPVEGKDYQAYEYARLDWEQNLRLFDGRVKDAKVEANRPAYEHWGLGVPFAYKLKNGAVLVRFSADRTLEFPVEVAGSYPHLVIAGFQSAQIEKGRKVDRLHPFLDRMRQVIHQE